MLEPKDVINIILSLRGDVWLVWNFYSAVTLALLGWLVSHRKDFDLLTRQITAAAYSFFYIVTTITFIKIYWELDMAVRDLNSLQQSLQRDFPEGGFAESLINTNYLGHIYYAVVITLIVSSCLVWLLLKNPWSLFGNAPVSKKPN